MQFPARANEGDREHRMTKNEWGDRGGAVIVMIGVWLSNRWFRKKILRFRIEIE